MTSETLAGLAGLVLSVIFEYVPGVEAWFGALDAVMKRLVMLGLMLVVAVAVYFAACYTPWQSVTCDNTGIVVLIEAFVAALVANQVAHKVFKKS